MSRSPLSKEPYNINKSEKAQISTINPATGKVLHTYPLMDKNEINKIIVSAHNAYQKWRHSELSERQQRMMQLRELLLKRKDEFARLMTAEMGKPITQMLAEIDKCALLCKHYVDHTESYLAPRIIKTEHASSYVCYEPLGIVFSIMPWNFPLWQVMRFLVPNLMAGNSTLLRHADCVTGTGLMIEKLVHDAGYPEHLLSAVIIDNDMAAEIIADPRIIGVTLTGSERAGRAVGSEAGKALKRVVLELGGSDPYVILADADLEHAAETCVSVRLANCGQVCVSPKRFIAVKEIYEPFKQLVLAKAKRYISSEPQDPLCNLGPMAREDLRANLHQQIQDSVAKGAKILLGGTLPKGPGFFYPVTVLSDIKPGMPAYEDEFFGPVINLIYAKDEQEALHIANDVRFGLGAGVFTRDIAKGEHIARHVLQAGMCAVNSAVTSDPRMPFGGVKSSGFGRELSNEGLYSFMNIKSIYVD